MGARGSLRRNRPPLVSRQQGEGSVTWMPHSRPSVFWNSLWVWHPGAGSVGLVLFLGSNEIVAKLIQQQDQWRDPQLLACTIWMDQLNGLVYPLFLYLWPEGQREAGKSDPLTACTNQINLNLLKDHNLVVSRYNQLKMKTIVGLYMTVPLPTHVSDHSNQNSCFLPMLCPLILMKYDV